MNFHIVNDYISDNVPDYGFAFPVILGQDGSSCDRTHPGLKIVNPPLAGEGC